MKFFKKSYFSLFISFFVFLLSASSYLFYLDFVLQETSISSLCLTHVKTSSEESITLLKNLPSSSSTLDLVTFSAIASSTHSQSKFSEPPSNQKFISNVETEISCLNLDFLPILVSYYYQFSPRAPPFSKI